MKKIIMDCDPGHDDAIALLLAAHSEDIQILGVTTVAGNSELANTTRNEKNCYISTKVNRELFVKMIQEHMKKQYVSKNNS